MDIHKKMKELGISFSDAPLPAANYVPFVQSGSQLFVSGQIPMTDDGMVIGRLGETMDVDDGAKAAELCAISLLAQVNKALDGDFSRLVRVVKLTGFVNSTPEFGDQPAVINGASNLFVALLGDRGQHARSAVSAGALPFGVAVEIEAIFEIA